MSEMKIFISWSGEASKRFAEILRRYLPFIIQGLDPFMSDQDLGSGSRWALELAKKLDNCDFGILCLTRECLQSPWMLFEAGALTKHIEGRACCLLFGDLTPADVSGPLAQFQNRSFTEDGFRRLLSDVHDLFAGCGLDKDGLRTVFEQWWPKLEKEVHNVLIDPSLTRPIPPKPQETVLLEELVLRVRNIQSMVETIKVPASTSHVSPSPGNAQIVTPSTRAAETRPPDLEARRAPTEVNRCAAPAPQSLGASPPVSGLGVYVPTPPSASSGCLNLTMRIDNKTGRPAEMSAVTLRYWYKDRGLGSELILSSQYVSIGYSNKGKVLGVKSIPCPGLADATHYLELAFNGTLAATGDKKQNDQFNVNVNVHNSGYSGKVDVTSDYSYNGGVTGYNDRITLHGGGKVLWGTPPRARQ